MVVGADPRVDAFRVCARRRVFRRDDRVGLRLHPLRHVERDASLRRIDGRRRVDRVVRVADDAFLLRSALAVVAESRVSGAKRRGRAVK